MLWPILNTEDINPFTQIRQLQRNLNQLFDCSAANCNSYPAINVWSNKDNIFLSAELPGIDMEKLNVTVSGTELILEGEYQTESLPEKAVYYRKERKNSKFQRVLQLPFEVNSEKTFAQYTNGVLNITMPKLESAKARKIEVKSA